MQKLTLRLFCLHAWRGLSLAVATACGVAGSLAPFACIRTQRHSGGEGARGVGGSKCRKPGGEGGRCFLRGAWVCERDWGGREQGRGRERGGDGSRGDAGSRRGCVGGCPPCSRTATGTHSFGGCDCVGNGGGGRCAVLGAGGEVVHGRTVAHTPRKCFTVHRGAWGAICSAVYGLGFLLPTSCALWGWAVLRGTLLPLPFPPPPSPSSQPPPLLLHARAHAHSRAQMYARTNSCRRLATRA